MPNRKLRFPLTELKETIASWFYLEPEGANAVDVVVAAHLANRFNADPLWLLLIAPPSNTKTELLRAFDGHPDAVFISNLTPATLVSGIIPKNGRPDPSLLLQLDGRTVILKDFTTILSLRSEQQQEIIAQLREIYDGQYTKIFGNGKHVNWSGKVGLIGACTPVYDRHHAVIGAMGERFLLYRTEGTDGAAMGLQAQKIVGRENQMRGEIREALHRFLAQFDDLSAARFEKDEDINTRIVALACFVAYARCPVARNWRNQAIEYQPQPEGTPRLVKQLMQLGMGLALAHGENRIGEATYSIIRKVGLDLVPVQRLRVLHYLWEAKAVSVLNGWVTTTEVADGTDLPGTTAKMLLEDLMVVGAVKRVRGEPDGQGRPPYLWQLAGHMVQWVGAAELFDG